MEKLQYNNHEKEKFITQNLVVKIGSSTITGGTGYLDTNFIDSIADQASSLFHAGIQISIVTSGAVECGRSRVSNFDGSDMSKRRAAARGQGILMRAWSDAFAKYNIETDQIITTDHNLRSCWELLKSTEGSIAIVNGNDAVNTMKEEQVSTNNDKLARFVTRAVGADTLALLTDVEGVLDTRGRLINTIYLDENLAGKVIFTGASKIGTGGMETKHLVGMKLAQQNTNVVIAHGREKNVLLKIARGEQVGTKYLKSRI